MTSREAGPNWPPVGGRTYQTTSPPSLKGSRGTADDGPDPDGAGSAGAGSAGAGAGSDTGDDGGDVGADSGATGRTGTDCSGWTTWADCAGSPGDEKLLTTGEDRSGGCPGGAAGACRGDSAGREPLSSVRAGENPVVFEPADVAAVWPWR